MFVGSQNEAFATDPATEHQIVALKSDQQALQRNPTPPQQAETRKHIDALAKAVEQRAAKNPDNIAVQHSAARFALQAGDTAKAIERADKTLALAEKAADPDLVRRTLITRSMAHATGKDYAGACEDARRVLKDDPGNATALELRLFNCGRGAAGPSLQASDTYRWLAQQTPTIPHTPDQWAARQKQSRTASFAPIAASMQALKAGDAAAALRRAEEAVGADANDPMAWAQRGLAKSRLEDFNGAVLDLSRAIAMGMVWNVLYKLRAEALIKNGQHKAAVADASMAVALDPKDGSAYAARATAKLGAGAAADDILGDFEQAAKLDPARYQAAFERAKTDLAARAGGLPGGGTAAGGTAAGESGGGDALPLTDAQRRALAGWQGDDARAWLPWAGLAAMVVLALLAAAVYQKRSAV